MHDGKVGPSETRTYLVVVAHPDDADFGVAGTVAKLAREGNTVHYLVCSSGGAGTEDPTQDEEELCGLREQEQDAAARILGVASTRYLRLPDGEIEPTLALRKELVRHMRRVRADVVVTLDPRTLINDESTYLNHPDHRAAGQAALDAAFPAAGNPGAFRELLSEGLPAHKVQEIWLTFTSAQHANHWVDITDTLDLKIQALEAHVSQIGDWARSGEMRAEITRWAESGANQRPELGYRYAEGFQRVILESEAPRRPIEAEAAEEQSEPV